MVTNKIPPVHPGEVLLGHPERRAAMGRAAAEYARNYDWEKIAKQIVGVYGEITEKKSRDLLANVPEG